MISPSRNPASRLANHQIRFRSALARDRQQPLVLIDVMSQGSAAGAGSLPLPPRQRCHEIMEFGLDLSRSGHRLRNLLPEELAITLPEPMNSDLERAFRCAHLSGSAAYGASA